MCNKKLKEMRDRRATRRLSKDHPIKKEGGSRTEKRTKRLITSINSNSRKIKTLISPTDSKKVGNSSATPIRAVQEEVKGVITPDSPDKSAPLDKKLIPNQTLRGSMKKIKPFSSL